MSKGPLTYLSLCGMLGYGYPRESLEKGLAAGPAFIGVDNGSTDPGPYYLGSGTSFLKRLSLKRDLEPALVAAMEHRIPLIVGSAGGSGATPHVEWFLSILEEIAQERGLHFRVATIRADLDPEIVETALAEGRISPCGPAPELSVDAIRGCPYLVGQMGTGPIEKAIQSEADVIVVGRCCDTAVFAAIPMMRGFDGGLAMHCAKIAECGTLCATPGGANDGLICTIHQDHFVVTPANEAKACTPQTVAAHSLYEQPDPNCFYEPEGKVDLSTCSFEAIDGRSVRVSGSRLLAPEKQTIKIEGARPVGLRAVTIAGVRDPAAIEHWDAVESGVHEAVGRNLQGVLDAQEYSLRFLRYGRDAVLGEKEPVRTPPHEMGIVIEAIAPTQDQADAVLALARSTALHQGFEGRKTTAGNLAFPFSPSDFSGGPVYEFAVYHLMETDDEDALFPVEVETW